MSFDVLYFAWLRERIGQPSERIESSARTVGELVTELAAKDDWHAAAFADMSAVRCAVDQQLAEMETPIEGAREIAFFPPMTGG
ncbi:molybdopterin converting factor subunit 1 [Paracoccus seriniphilus]|uniref:Molybdopterin synthase subunit MoaD n=1 Tax=Paracoccus seriniphilus TaxID=184748 RepID=A0A239PLL2_9RHOB|nr:molybdopterin converting factor subunit 1 [Paracoccus seriniphilus]WCR13698.1 molybdopterin converting factor subunit 1 [Paracoccus seriniphilus]SNT68701.1 molybdopterin synthase subunit MoaD [Paracoccus seriniphilus]